MVKGEDAVIRKKNKVRRKKLSTGDSAVSARIATIIATKKRRKSGKRRVTEGMCFSAPTPGDPFNDRQGKKAKRRVRKKKMVSAQADGVTFSEEKNDPSEKGITDEKGVKGQSDCPSKFLFMCLKKIQDALQQDGCYNGIDQPLYFSEWGIEFWKCSCTERDILESSGSGSVMEKIAWLASSAADTISRKEKEGLSFSSPFLLFLVPSQERAVKLRAVCRPLKSLGIHTVSLHPGASIEHQIHGLKGCDPEFLVSTPERLLELVNLEAIDISGVSVVVVDGLEVLSGGGYADMINSIQKCMSGSPRTVVFSDCSRYPTVNMVRSLMTGPICRLSLDRSIKSQSACILQSVHVFTSQEEKQSQGFQVIEQACTNPLSLPCNVLIVVENGNKFSKVVAGLTLKGYSIPATENSSNFKALNRRRAISMINEEQINSTNLGKYEVIIILDFVSTINSYAQILTRMARHTVNGVLHSFFTRENARLSGPLIDILEECGQAVPEILRSMNDSPSPI